MKVIEEWIFTARIRNGNQSELGDIFATTLTLMRKTKNKSRKSEIAVHTLSSRYIKQNTHETIRNEKLCFEIRIRIGYQSKRRDIVATTATSVEKWKTIIEETLKSGFSKLKSEWKIILKRSELL